MLAVAIGSDKLGFPASAFQLSKEPLWLKLQRGLGAAWRRVEEQQPGRCSRAASGDRSSNERLRRCADAPVPLVRTFRIGEARGGADFLRAEGKPALRCGGKLASAGARP